MKTNYIFILAALLLSLETKAQNHLLLTNKKSGKGMKISGDSYITFQLNNIPKLYTDWKVERLKDSSFVLSTYSFCRDSSYSFNEREIREIPFSSLDQYKFRENNGKRMAAAWGLLGGGFLLIAAPLGAYDSEKKQWSNETFFTTAAIGTVVFTTSYFFMRKILRKEQYFNNKEWNLSTVPKKIKTR